jgi:hypothetical protein
LNYYDYACQVTFLLGPGGSYTTGSTFVVDGGVMAANTIGSDTFLRNTIRPVRETFPVEGELPDFCVADDGRMQLMVDSSDTSASSVKEEIKMLEQKLQALRGINTGR